MRKADAAFAIKVTTQCIWTAVRETAIESVEQFGRDYAMRLGRWIDENYGAVRVFGDPPLRAGSDFGIAVLSRRR